MAQENNKKYYSILQWVIERGIVSEKGEAFSFHDRPWLIDILTDQNPEIVVTACAQVGKTVTFIIKILYAIKHMGLQVIYTMPTDDDVRETVASKVNKLISANNHEFEGMDSDSIERKEINGRFVFFKGTVSKTAAISTTADLLVHDELSRSDQLAIHTYKSRTKASPYKGRWLFSNPGTERDELDLAWEKSDKKEWVIECPHCKDRHFLSFPESVDQERKCYICKECKAPISDDVRRKGKWEAQNKVSKISGYHISHLMCCWISAEEIIEDSKGDPAYFNNFVLGKPYSPGDVSITKSTILDIWTPKELDNGKRYIGIDVGNLKHYVVRSDKGIVKLGRFSQWSELDDILTYWKPVSGVIDAMPDNVAARHYVATYPYMRMSYFQENMSNPQTIVWWGKSTEPDSPSNKQGIVYSHRYRILDQMFTEMVEAKWLIGVPSDDMFRLFIKHYETMRRAKVTNAKGIEQYTWESTTSENHFVFADLYSYLAMLGQGSGEFFGQPTYELQTFIGVDNKMRKSLGDMIEEMNDYGQN